MPRTATWEELLATPTGASIIVVSVSGALAQPRDDDFGDARTAVVQQYEIIGNMIAVVTMNTLTGRYNGYLVGQGRNLPHEDEWEDIAFYSAFDGHGIRIDADGGIKVVGIAPVATKDEAITKTRTLARTALGMASAEENRTTEES